MKYAFNIIIAVAVAILYFLHFKSSGDQNKNAAVQNPGDITAPVAQLQTPAGNSSKIVYINADTLFAKYNYVKELKKDAMAKQSRIEALYKEKAQELERDYTDYQTKAGAGLLSVDQSKEIEAKLMSQKNDMDMTEAELGRLQEDTQRKNLVVQEEINVFLQEFNKNSDCAYVLAYTTIGSAVLYANNNLDITNQVVAELNARYAEKKAPKKGSVK